MLAVGGYLLHDLDDRCVRMATGFGGGVGGTHEELCGAFSAGIMIIGALYGRVSASKDDTRAYGLAKEYRQRFAERWGCLNCGPIRDWAKSAAGPGSCAPVVTESARILLDLLDQT